MSIKSSTYTTQELVAKFGASRATLRHVIYSHFAMGRYGQCLRFYKILPCTGQEFKDHLKDGMYYGFDPSAQNHVNFHLVYKECTPTEVKRAEHVALSFRIARDEFNIEPVVVVQLPRLDHEYKSNRSI